MAIKYTPDYNERLYKIVENYNRKVRRARTEGNIKKSQLPETVSIKTLKKSYSTRKELDKELKNLEVFTRKSARNRVVDGLTEYDLKLMEMNRKDAIKFFEKQAGYVAAKAKANYPLQKSRLAVLERNIELLKKGPEKATDRELVAMQRYIEKYRRSYERQASGYRAFMSEVEMIMDRVGIPKERKEEFFTKMSKLDEQELYDLYETEDIISKIYELADSPKYTGGELVIYASDTEAENLINLFMDRLDGMIAKVKGK